MRKSDWKNIEAAFDLVIQAAKGEKRNQIYQASASLKPYPYWGHLYAVFSYLITWGVTDVNILIASILHDVVEDSDIPLDDIEERFGGSVRMIVDLCTKPKDFTQEDTHLYYQRSWDYLDKDELIATAAMKIKVADRLDNWIGLQFTSDSKRKQKYIEESTKYFLPMAKRVGLEVYLHNTGLFAESLIS